MMYRIWCRGSLEFPREFTLSTEQRFEVSNKNSLLERPTESAPENVHVLAKAWGGGYYVFAWDKKTSIWNEINFSE